MNNGNDKAAREAEDRRQNLLGALLAAAELGYKCCEKGMSIAAAIEHVKQAFNGK